METQQEGIQEEVPEMDVSQENIKNKKYLIIGGIVILSITLVALAIFIIVGLVNLSGISESDDSSGNQSASSIASMSSSSSSAGITETSSSSTAFQIWETYTYDYDYIDPSFSFTYPADWNYVYSDRPVEWDISLTKTVGETIRIDYSGFNDPYAEDTSYLKYLDSWANYGQSEDFSFTAELVKADETNDIPYRVYKVTSADSQFFLAVMDVANHEGKKGELGIRTGTLSEEDMFWEILYSVQRLRN